MALTKLKKKSFIFSIFTFNTYFLLSVIVYLRCEMYRIAISIQLLDYLLMGIVNFMYLLYSISIVRGQAFYKPWQLIVIITYWVMPGKGNTYTNFWKQPQKFVLVMQGYFNANWSRCYFNSHTMGMRRNKLLKPTRHTYTYLNFLRPISQLINMHIICTKRLSSNYLALVTRMLIPTYSNCTFTF